MIRWTVFIVVFCAFLLACTTQNLDNSKDIAIPKGPTSNPGDVNWREVDLADIRTGETFRISNLQGKPLLIESFAVWCPFCTKQQNEVKRLHQMVGDDVISISLDTDPNEDADTVLEHITSNEFTWRYAVTPAPFVKSLIAEFGVGVVNAPAVPMVLICHDGSSRLLPRGVKPAEQLLEEIERGCDG